jgi:prepilin-type N-terminal cleavage/methylation domain-containing protein
MKNYFSVRSTQDARTRGFTLLEFLVSMAVFMIVTGSVFSLFRKDDPLFNQQQNVAGLNIALQNSITQIQTDAVNAGSGYYAGTQIPSFPVGITIAENMVAGVVTAPAVGDCGDNTTFLYHADCFDTLNIIAADPLTAPQHLGAVGLNIDTTTGSLLLYTPTVTTNAAAKLVAAQYKAGDTLLLLKSDGSQMTTVTLTAAAPVPAGTTVTINFTAQSSASPGVNPTDPFLMTKHSGGTTDNSSTQIGNLFGNLDWILRLQPITYSVDDTNPADPKLIRTANGTSDVVAEQIVGFKVGASTANKLDTLDGSYSYDASTFGSTGFDFSIVRSIRVTVIGRTPPTASSASTVLNSYDSGPYSIQGLSTVVNPRNLSMGDN